MRPLHEMMKRLAMPKGFKKLATQEAVPYCPRQGESFSWVVIVKIQDVNLRGSRVE